MPRFPRVTLAFVDAVMPTRRLTRDVPSVDRLAIHAGTTPGDEVLCHAHGRGQTLLGFPER